MVALKTVDKTELNCLDNTRNKTMSHKIEAGQFKQFARQIGLLKGELGDENGEQFLNITQKIVADICNSSNVASSVKNGIDEIVKHRNPAIDGEYGLERFVNETEPVTDSEIIQFVEELGNLVNDYFSENCDDILTEVTDEIEAKCSVIWKSKIMLLDKYPKFDT